MPKLKENGLTALAVSRMKTPGFYCDGMGLYLSIGKGAGRSWVFRYRESGKLRDIGLGSARAVSLADAREKAAALRKLRANGTDPRDHIQKVKEANRTEPKKRRTFKECADAYVTAHEASWRNDKHCSQWKNTLRDYCYPTLGSMPVDTITTKHVLDVLEPIWREKTETASRIRGRIETVLNWAKARGERQGDNPAAWRGHLDHLLPAKGKIARKGHHPALPYGELPGFMSLLRAQEGVSALALEIIVLAACRTREAIEATWQEFDMDRAIWTIPVERMKAGRSHTVPLSPAALAVLAKARKLSPGDYVFAGRNIGRPLSNMSCLMLLKRMERGDLTAHGFRSTFSDWCAETTHFSHEVREMALAHTIKNKVEAAYRRGDLLEKRRELMEAWAIYCDGNQ